MPVRSTGYDKRVILALSLGLLFLLMAPFPAGAVLIGGLFGIVTGILPFSMPMLLFLLASALAYSKRRAGELGVLIDWTGGREFEPVTEGGCRLDMCDGCWDI